MRNGSTQHAGRGRTGKWNVEGVAVAPPPAGRRLDWRAVFGNDRPVEVEIGTGKGTFLLERASARPEVNFLGIEYARAYGLYAADRFRRHGLANVRMLCTDAGGLFAGAIEPASLQRLHIYFPDPWPKRRHHRRRLIQPPFVRDAVASLRLGGQLLIVTDHLGYYRHIASVLEGWPGLARTPFPAMTDADGQIVGTNFERKYIAQGRPFFQLARLVYRWPSCS
jgi:tRNA (guanine-N7-)-methyltransferase